MSAKSVEHFACLPPVPLDLFDEISNATTRTTYRRVVTEFASWCSTHNQPLSSATVLDYREHLAKLAFSPSTINQRLSAIRRFVAQAAGTGSISLTLAAEVIRVRGKSVSKVSRAPGLTPYEAERLIGATDPHTLRGSRDRALLALLIGCGLRRREAVGLQIEAIQQRGDRWFIIDIPGKRGSSRTVPIPGWVADSIHEWLAKADIAHGPLFCALSRHGRLSRRPLSEKAILDIVRSYGRSIGILVSPHDLRRTCAKLCRSFGGEIEQIQLLLGHSNVQVTAKYLERDIASSGAANDHLPSLVHGDSLSNNRRPVTSVQGSEASFRLVVSR